MTDKELLELAAKAAGIEIEYFYGDGDEIWAKHEPRMTDAAGWNPLTDDGDALRVAVKLDMDIKVNRVDGITIVAFGYYECQETLEPHNDDPYAATRRAIVRAAAEIGRTL